MKSGTNSVLFSEESTYIPKATSTQVNNVVIAEDGTVTIDF